MPNEQVIDVEPVAHSSERSAKPSGQPASGYYTYQQNPSATDKGAHYYAASKGASANTAQNSKFGAAAKIVAGGACALVGVPMLVLPGPGLLAIGGGVALMASGVKDFKK